MLYIYNDRLRSVRRPFNNSSNCTHRIYNLQSCLPVLSYYDTRSYFVIIIIQIIFFRAVLRWQENIQLCAEWIWNCFWEWRIYGIHCWHLRTRKFGRYNVRETQCLYWLEKFIFLGLAFIFICMFGLMVHWVFKAKIFNIEEDNHSSSNGSVNQYMHVQCTSDSFILSPCS